MKESIAFALRSLRRSPAFVSIAVLSFGTAMGLSAAVLALIDAIKHPTSPYHQVDQLFAVELQTHGAPGPAPQDVRRDLTSTDIVGVATYRPVSSDIDAGDVIERRPVAFTSPNILELLAIAPRLGRVFTTRDGSAGNIAVVSEDLWRRMFANRESLGDAVVHIAEQPYKVIGVLPHGATLAIPTSAKPQPIDVWIPENDAPSAHTEQALVRLTGGASTLTSMQGRLRAAVSRWTNNSGIPHGLPFSGRLISLRPDPLELTELHRALTGAALCVLLIACANVTALMLARGISRRRDFALRLALGATRAEVARLVLVEVLTLAMLGAAVGGLIAVWIVELMSHVTPEEMRGLGFVEPQWSARVFALSAICILVCIAISGAVPAWDASRTTLAGPLRDSGGGTTGRVSTRFRWLVMAELALSMTLLVGTSLMVESTGKLSRYSFGYDARSLLSVDFAVWRGTPIPQSDQIRTQEDALQRVRNLPGVESVALMSSCAAQHDILTTDRTIEGGPAGYVPRRCANLTSGFFHTVGTSVVEGRDFSEGDRAGSGAVILDQRTARRLFPHEHAVGRMIKLGQLSSDLPWLTVVGVTRDQDLTFNAFPENGPDSTSRLYVSLPPTDKSQAAAKNFREAVATLVIRPDVHAHGVPNAIMRALRSTLPPGSSIKVQPLTA